MQLYFGPLGDWIRLVLSCPSAKESGSFQTNSLDIQLPDMGDDQSWCNAYNQAHKWHSPHSVLKVLQQKLYTGLGYQD